MHRHSIIYPLWNVPEAHSAVLSSRQEDVSGGVSSQSPDRTIHVTVHQNVTSCVLFTNLNDLSIPSAYENLPLNNQGGGHREPYDRSGKIASLIFLTTASWFLLALETSCMYISMYLFIYFLFLHKFKKYYLHSSTAILNIYLSIYTSNIQKFFFKGWIYLNKTTVKQLFYEELHLNPN